MKKYLIALIATAAAVGVWQKDAIQEAWETRGMTEDEKSEWRQDHADEEELENELDELEDELEDEEASGSDSLDELEDTE